MSNVIEIRELGTVLSVSELGVEPGVVFAPDLSLREVRLGRVDGNRLRFSFGHRERSRAGVGAKEVLEVRVSELCASSCSFAIVCSVGSPEGTIIHTARGAVSFSARSSGYFTAVALLLPATASRSRSRLLCHTLPKRDAASYRRLSSPGRLSQVACFVLRSCSVADVLACPGRFLA